ncbi:BACON domain-containing protein [Methanosarcina sp. KYL-1]|uniref:BACON domain-containing protein n=1 Tax=Methanosarcina sp. KYL-1 TaxID=2602068 RepID=UPI00210129D6|nr:BACON domain-containing carbohydrate-binding protein [Methanosarcina sp. KYL-1]
MSKKEIKNLETRLKNLTDKEKVARFKDASEEISRGILEGNITGEEAIEEISTVLENSLETKASFLARAALSFKNIPLPVKIAILVMLPVTAVIALVIMPSLSMSEGDMNFNLAEGESDFDQFQVSNAGGGILLWTASSDQPWITLSPKRGGNSDTVTVIVDAGGMKEGTYEGTITVESPAGTEQCPVYLSVEPSYKNLNPVLEVSPDPLSFNFDLIEGESDYGEFDVSNDGEGILEWEVSADEPWITLSLENGTNSDTVTVTVNTEELSPGEEYEGTITIESNGGDEEGIIYLNVLPEGEKPEEKPILAVDPDPLYFNFELIEGESDSEEFYISNDGEGDLEWEVNADPDRPSWISIGPISGTNEETVTVTVDAADLIPGEYNTTFRVESNGGNEEGTVNLIVPGEKEGPDLVTSLEVTGPVTHAMDEDAYNFSVPVSVVVRNQGDEAAEIFKVGAVYSMYDGTYMVALRVPGESDTRFPYTDEPLDPGEEVTFEGEVLFSDSFPGEIVYLKAIADSCIGDEGFSDYCRVEESNEDNNESPEVEVYLPYPELEGPDLVTSLEVTGPATLKPVDGVYLINVPITVVVRNQGDEAADIFKVEAMYAMYDETHTVAFRVPGESNTRYPYTDATLGPGEEVFFEGEVLFSDSLSGETVYLTAIADSCIEDEFVPDYCRVEESDEDNNESPPEEVYLPIFIE